MKRRKGFSLVEVVTVLMLLGVVAGIAVARNSMTDIEVHNEAEVIKSRLRYAQYLSLAGNDTNRWGIRFSSGTYALIRENQSSGTKTVQSFPNESAIGYTLLPGAGVSIDSVVDSSSGALAMPAEVIFDQWGSPGTGNITISMSQGAETESISILGSTGFVQ